jgi:CRISPR-associated exonuclease Cas4
MDLGPLLCRTADTRGLQRRAAMSEAVPPELESVPISALQHWHYCPRQCALIHLDQVFDENVYTLRGQALHSMVDTPGFESRNAVRIERALPIWSQRLGLSGKADAVEFQSDGTPYPVEYKHGSKRKAARIAECDAVQLAAQAMCLEEMTGMRVKEGAIFYASSKRRLVIEVSDVLRLQVENATAAVREMLAARSLPPAVNDERCRACSLIDQCQPRISQARGAIEAEYLKLFDPEL